MAEAVARMDSSDALCAVQPRTPAALCRKWKEAQGLKIAAHRPMCSQRTAQTERFLLLCRLQNTSERPPLATVNTWNTNHQEQSTSTTDTRLARLASWELGGKAPTWARPSSKQSAQSMPVSQGHLAIQGFHFISTVWLF